MYALPSTSQTCAPLALWTKIGCPPTARNARTGELTPPGMYFSASAKRASDLAREIMVEKVADTARKARRNLTPHQYGTDGLMIPGRRGRFDANFANQRPGIFFTDTPPTPKSNVSPQTGSCPHRRQPAAGLFRRRARPLRQAVPSETARDDTARAGRISCGRCNGSRSTSASPG